jgi:phospholipid transport system substrate-binding protein
MERRHARWVSTLGLMLALRCAAGVESTASALADSPEAVVETSADKVLAILNSGASENEKIKRLQQVAYETIDFDTVSRLVLAKYWRQFTTEQRRRFQDEFKQALALSYSRRIGHFGREKVVILEGHPEPNGDATVHTKIVGGKAQDLKVTYRLRQKGGTWYLIDVTVEGVSIVSSYRTQFQEIIGQGGPERLLVELREKNANGEGLAPVEPTKQGT